MYKRRKKVHPQASSTLIGGEEFLVGSSQSSVSTSFSGSSITSKPSSPPLDKENVNTLQSSQRDAIDIPGRKTAKFNEMPSRSRSPRKVDVIPNISPDSFSRISSVSEKKFDFLEETLLSAGFVLCKDMSHNTLKQDQAVFIRNVSKALSSSKEKDVIKKFLLELKNYLSNKELFKISLLPTKTCCEVNIARGEYQGSLIRLLLTIECLQPSLIEFLLNSLSENITPVKGADEECTMWVKMILQPMRFLPKIIEPAVVTQRLFDVIHSTSAVVLQHEIITCLPEIIADEQREEVSKELLDLLKVSPNLTPTILNALSNFCLEGDCRFELQMNLIRSLRRTEISHVASYMSFIIASPPINHLDEIFNGLRSELVLCHAGDHLTQQISSDDRSSVLSLIFERIRSQILLNKKFADIWLKNIGKIKSHKQHKPIDLLILIILYSVATDVLKKRAIENLIKTKIRTGHFQTSLIDETLDAALIVIVTYFNDLLKLMSTLLVVNDVIISKYFFLFYVSCFKKMESYHRKMIIINLIDCVTKNINVSKPVLNVLQYLTENYTSFISPFATRITHLLDLVGEMNTGEIRELMDILCTMAFSDASIDSSASFQDEIYMIAQKQLCCPDPKIYRSGIVCAITVVKFMVNMQGDEMNVTPENSELIMLNPQSEKAFNLLELVLNGTQCASEDGVLIYDQLSFAIMTCPNMDKAFKKKVSQIMQGSFQTHYVIASSSFKKNDDLETSLEYCLDNDLEDPIALNIVGAILEERNRSQMSHSKVITLPSLLRVIRALELADLSEIDALLGCAVVFPSFTFYSKFGLVEPYFQKIGLDALFHTCNWFRESINSFVYLIKEGSPDNILIRLRGIVQLQNMIASCLAQAVAYTPPQYFLDENSKTVNLREKTKRIKKPVNKSNRKKNEKENEDEETLDEPPPTQAESDEGKEEDEFIAVEFSKLRNYMRELDFDVFLLLTHPLNLHPQPVNGSNITPEFGPSELMLILEDLNAKLKFCLEVKKPLQVRQVNGFENLMNIPINLIVRNTTKLTNHIANQLQKIVEHFHHLCEIHDNIMDVPSMFGSGMSDLKKCTALIFSVYNTYFSWPELKSDEYIKCLLKCALKLGGQSVDKGKGVTINFSLQSGINYLKTISKCMLDLCSAVNLVVLIDTLRNLQDGNEEDNKIVKLDEICEYYLKRKWYDFKGVEVKGTLLNQQMNKLLELFFIDGEIENISRTLLWITDEIGVLDENKNLNSFPHFNKGNLHILISCLCKCLTNVTKKGLEGKDFKEQLAVWERVINCLQQLVLVIKAQDTKLNLRQFLKGCLPVLKLFLSQGMNVFSVMFKIEMNTVSQCLKNLQVITRYIQNICNYSKVSKDNSLIQQLPSLRGILEMILLSVKNMILQNKCADAFFMGSMKNKDHHGEVIASQELTDTREDDEPEAQDVEMAESDNEDITNATSGSLSDTC
ncbi:Fanconi anemia group D2 protein isoform X2 [Cimex lectularius]|uniref:Fanconi anemia group D2 protein n=1 Tax=Cimex lectularius TaxID=79782 RepID=A0A8I6RA57_CIMLE|nr:Fanconi anemia group D2 protein isoform X2 [Cimex lectularius]